MQLSMPALNEQPRSFRQNCNHSDHAANLGTRLQHALRTLGQQPLDQAIDTLHAARFNRATVLVTDCDPES